MDREEISDCVIRIKTPEGWLIIGNNAYAVCYVPDKKHKWKIKSTNEEKSNE